MGNRPSLTNEAKEARWREMFEGFAFSDVSNVDVAQVDEWEASDADRVVLIDCRDEAEQRVSMVPAAVTKTAFMEQLCLGWCPADGIVTHIVCYCTIGYRSVTARALVAHDRLCDLLADAPELSSQLMRIVAATAGAVQPARWCSGLGAQRTGSSSPNTDAWRWRWRRRKHCLAHACSPRVRAALDLAPCGPPGIRCLDGRVQMPICSQT